jgi:hypothetical protein
VCDQTRCLALDNVEKWDERDILLVSPSYDFWERAVQYDAQVSDNFWHVFEDIAMTVYSLCCKNPEVARTTSEALSYMRRSVFNGKIESVALCVVCVAGCGGGVWW